MYTTRKVFDQTLASLTEATYALDTETTGLHPFNRGHRPFAIILAGAKEEYYFNFNAQEGLTEDEVLGGSHMERLAAFFKTPRTWVMHNAKFDMHMLSFYGATPVGRVVDTAVMARLIDNEHPEYTLEACAARIGLKKDTAVEDYIKEKGLWVYVQVPGKNKRDKDMFFDRVPHATMVKYGCTDARITYDLGMWQEKKLASMSQGAGLKQVPPKLALLPSLVSTEQALTRVVQSMEARGLRVDVGYCRRAVEVLTERQERIKSKFYLATGKVFKTSGKLFAEVFQGKKHMWRYTEKGNPTFDSDTLVTFHDPVADLILEYRNAKSRADFFNTFLYFMDTSGVVHPTLNTSGTRTGRFSSSDPNFQNLSADDETEEQDAECKPRGAILPREGYSLLSIDFDQQEYKLAAILAEELPVIEKIRAGADFHSIVAELIKRERRIAKRCNFLLLFGGGGAHLARQLGIPESEGRRLRQEYFAMMPAIRGLMYGLSDLAAERGFIINPFGRVLRFPRVDMSYKALNTLIQSTGADIMKVCLVRVGDYLADKKSKIILTVHDELLIEMHDDEHYIIPEVKAIMEGVFINPHLTLTCSHFVTKENWGCL